MKSVLIFIGGLTIGAGISWVYHKNKYEAMVQEEVESLREHMQEKKEPIDVEEDEPFEVENIVEDESMLKTEYEDILNDNSYNGNVESMFDQHKKPFVVSPSDFGSIPGFDVDTLYYHNDGIISNDNQEMIDDVEELLGLNEEEIRDQFGVYEDDSVFIRNMRLKCDFEVLLDGEEFKRRNGD